MAITFRKGTNTERIYNVLLKHEFMKSETVAEKTGLPWTSISGELTRMRRSGLVEYSGTKGDLRWKKHPIEKPLYPPQKDIISRRSSGGRVRKAVADPTYAQVLGRCVELFNELGEEIQRLQDLDPCDAFESFGSVGGQKVYVKKQ